MAPRIYGPGIYDPSIYGDDADHGSLPSSGAVYAPGVYAAGVYGGGPLPPTSYTVVQRDGLLFDDLATLVVEAETGFVENFIYDSDGISLEDKGVPDRILINGAINVEFLDQITISDQGWQQLERYDYHEPPPAVVDETVATFQVRLRISPQTLVDVTNDVLRLSCGRKVARTLDSLDAGTLDLELDNAMGWWSPEIATKHGGGLRPGVQVEILQTSAASGSVFVLDQDRLDYGTLISPAFLFSGQIDKISVQPALNGPRVVSISARDRVKDLRRRRIDTEIMTSVNVGSVFTRILDIANVGSDVRTIAAIDDVWGAVWWNDRVLDTVITDMIEAGGYGAYVSKDGIFTVEDRNWDIGRTVVGTFATFAGLTYSLDDSRLVNVARVQGVPRTIASSPQVVAGLTQAVAVPRGQAVEFFLQFQDPSNAESAPAVNMLQPVAGTDWLLNATSDGSGTSLTSAASLNVTYFAESAKVRIFNASSTAGYLTRCNLRGRPFSRGNEVSYEERNESSIATFDENAWSLDTDLLSTHIEVQQRAQTMVQEHAQPQHQLQARLINQWPDQLSHDVGQVLHIVNTFIGIDGQYTIIEINHEINAADQGWVHATDYTLEAARNFETLVLDSPTRGLLDFNRIGRVSSYVAETVPLLYSVAIRDGVIFGEEA